MYHKIYESAIRQIDNGSMTKTEAIEWIRNGYHSEQNKKKAIRWNFIRLSSYNRKEK